MAINIKPFYQTGGPIPLDLQGYQLAATPTFQQQQYQPRFIDPTTFYRSQQLNLSRQQMGLQRENMELSRERLEESVRQFNEGQAMRQKEYNLDIYQQLSKEFEGFIDPETGIDLSTETGQGLYKEWMDIKGKLTTDGMSVLFGDGKGSGGGDG